MTISTETNRTSFSGNDVTTAFAVSFQFFADADLRVILVNDTTGVETVQTITTHYTVSGAGTGSGTVTMVTAPITGETLVIIRDADYSQELDLVNNDTLDAEELEDQLDKIVIQVLQLKDLSGRSFQLSEGDVSGISLELPNTAGNGLGLIRLNNTLTALEYAQAVDLDMSIVSTFVATLLDDSDADEFWATLMATIDKSAARTALNVEVADTNIVKSDVSTTYTVGYLHTAYDNGNTGTDTLTLDPALGLQQKATCTGSFTLAAAASGDGFFLELLLTMDGTGGYTVTLSGFEKEINGTIDTTASAKNLIRVTRIDGNDAIEIVQL